MGDQRAAGEQHRDENPGHEVLLAALAGEPDECRTCEWVEPLPVSEPARPVEDRPAWNAEDGTPQAQARRSLDFTGLARAAAEARIGEVGRLVEAGMTVTAAAAHVERIARIRADAEIARAQIRADRDQHQAGYQQGVRIGRVEGEAANLQPFDFTGEETTAGPSTYDAAVEAMHAAVRAVKPVDLSVIMLDDRDEAADQLAHFVTEVADSLVRWLSEHIETTDTGMIDGDPGIVPGGFVPLRERHPEHFADHPRCPCGALMMTSTAPGHRVVCSDPYGHKRWVGELGAAAGREDAALDAELVEDGDGAPLPPEQQPCPECRAGKHPNCHGYVLDDQDKHVVCPCPDDTHNGC